MKKNRAIVFTLTSDLAFAVASVMLDIKRLSPALADEVVIIHDGISKKDQELLGSILPSRFIVYDFPIKEASTINTDVLSRFTKMIFAKFECLKLLEDYKNILLLDYDLVIQQDLSELFEPCESGLKMVSAGIKVRGQLHEATNDYDMDAEGSGASQFVMQDHMKNYMKMYHFCYESLIRYGHILYMPEQAIFDFMIQEFNIQNYQIDPHIYNSHPNDKEFANNAKIIHSYGFPKFWNGLYNEQWNKNYRAWLKMGGSKYNQMTMKKICKKLNNIVTYGLKKIKVL
jgi:lipopolysaccharide biosynthesis glycosyltransferase